MLGMGIALLISGVFMVYQFLAKIYGLFVFELPFFSRSIYMALASDLCCSFGWLIGAFEIIFGIYHICCAKKRSLLRDSKSSDVLMYVFLFTMSVVSVL